MHISARYPTRVALLLIALIASTIVSFALPPTKPAHADPVCMVNGGVYVVFVRGSGAHLNDAEATEFHKQLIGDSTASGALNRPPLLPVATGWVELGNEDGDVDLSKPNPVPDSSNEYPAIGYADWGIFTGFGGYYNSVWTGVSELTQHLNDRAARCPKESIVIGGYSQGAEVVGYSLMSVSDYTLSHIGYAALYGDPRSTACNQYIRVPWARGNANCAFGILGTRLPYAPTALNGRVGSWCDESDGVCTGNLAYIPVASPLSTHLTAYKNRWISDSANEIAYNALTKLNQLNPNSPAVPIPSYSITPPDTSPSSPAATPLGPSPSTPVAISRNPNTMAVFYNDGANHLVNWSWDVSYGWSAQEWSDDIVGQPCAIVRDTNNMDVFYRTAEQKLVHRGWNVTNGWGLDTLVNTGVVGDPACVSRDSGDMQAFYLTSGGGIKSVAWNSTTGWNLNQQQLYNNGATSDPTAISRSSSGMDVFFGKNNGNLVHLAWSASSGWNTEDWSAGSGLTGRPTAITRNSGGDMSVYYQETNGRIAEQSWDWQTGWAWRDWNAQLMGSPSAVAGTTNVIDVLYRETSGNLVDRSFTGYGWVTNTVVGAGNATGNPSVITRGTNEEAFYWNGNTLMDANWNGSVWNAAPI